MWDEFLKIHANTLWACDFLSKKTWTLGGLVDIYLLVFIHIGSRRVWISAATANSHSARVAQQAPIICMKFEEEKDKPTWLMYDADTKLTNQFDSFFEREGVDVKRHTPASPTLNTHVERFSQSIQQECLDHFVAIDDHRLNYLTSEYVAHYHDERRRPGLGNELNGRMSTERNKAEDVAGEIVCRER